MLERVIASFSHSLIQAAQQFDFPIEDPAIRFMNFVGVALCLLTISLICYMILVKRKQITNVTTRWVLLIAFLILSPLTYIISFGIAIEKSKPVEFCNSCHPMKAYVNGLAEADSEHIASLHYQYRWISDNQCYKCHSDYGLFGAAQAKLGGIRHFLAFYIVGYETPLRIRGTYNNQRCLHCHSPVESFQDISEHQEYAEEIASSEQSCFGADCHVSPHPKEAATTDE